jgi:hypothetical protein
VVMDALMFSLSKRLRLLVTRLQVWRTLHPIDGHFVNQATESMLFGSWVKTWGFMPISWVTAFMHVQGISMVT